MFKKFDKINRRVSFLKKAGLGLDPQSMAELESVEA
jgi:hypothetical protein